MVPPATNSGRRSFRFRRKIGSGAFGEVYLAEMVTSGGFAKVVAVKVLKAEFLEEADIVSRMRDEARLLGHLRHPAIVQADDLLILGGRVAIVMEYVPGANLLWLIHPRQNAAPLPPTVLCAIIGRVAEALEAAWSRPSTLTGEPLRVLHRDIKPSNIRITPDGEVKVLDFGVARSDALERETSTHNQLIGSLTFLAPEVFLSHPVLPATDIYALGVTLFESIARRRFGRCGLTPEYHHELVHERVHELSLASWGACAEPLRRLLIRMLAFEPVQRPTAGSVAAFCVQSCRSLPGPELRDWARQHVERIARSAKADPGGELVGATLDEDSSHHPGRRIASAATIEPDGITDIVARAEDSRERRRGLLLAVLLLVFLLVPALLAVGVGVAWYMDVRGPKTVTSQPVAERSQARAAPEAGGASPSPPAEVAVADPTSGGITEDPPATTPSSVTSPSVTSPATATALPTPQAASPPPSSTPSAATTRTTWVAPQEQASAGAITPKASSTSQEARDTQVGSATGEDLGIEVSAPRRSLRNSALHASVNTGVTGCDVTVHWKTEGLTVWETAVLSGGGPVYNWTLDVTGQHRPAILYYITVAGCGDGSAGNAGEPRRIVVL